MPSALIIIAFMASAAHCSGQGTSNLRVSSRSLSATGNWCGSSWADAGARCTTACPLGVDSECPSGQHCYADVSCAGGPAPPSGGSNWCGASWTDAGARCTTTCPSGVDSECPSGQHCYAGVSCAGVPHGTPAPPSGGGGSLQNDCVGALNRARAQYNPSARPLVWASDLANSCSVVSEHCATVAQTHHCLGNQDGRNDNGVTCQSTGEFVWAQNLFITKQSCSAAYDGWITQEAASRGGHFLNTINSQYSKVGCSVATDGNACICCNFAS